MFLFLCVLLSFLWSGNGAWVQDTLRRQRDLAKDYVEYISVPVLATHNSFNTAKRGYIYPNQDLTITEQLDFGVRLINLDIHYVTASFNPPMRVCHGSSEARQACLLADEEARKIFPNVPNFYVCTTIITPPVFDYGSSTGCLSVARTVPQTLQEIKDWLDVNVNEAIMLDLSVESEVVSTDLDAAMESVLGSLLFTPQDKNNFFPDRYPTMQELIDLNKRVFAYSRDSSAGTYVHNIGVWPNYSSNMIKYFQPYPLCNSSRETDFPKTTILAGFYGDESVIRHPLDNSIIVSGEQLTGAFTIEIIKQLAVECGMMGMFDFVNDAKAKASIWIFEENRPNVDRSANCAVMGETGRWRDEDCSLSYRAACVDDEDAFNWQLSEYRKFHWNFPHVFIQSESGTWMESFQNCPEGFSFGVPRLPSENFQLILAKNSSTVVWLNYRDVVQEGMWVSGFVNTTIHQESTTTTPDTSSSTESLASSSSDGTSSSSSAVDTSAPSSTSSTPTQGATSSKGTSDATQETNTTEEPSIGESTSDGEPTHDESSKDEDVSAGCLHVVSFVTILSWVALI